MRLVLGGGGSEEQEAANLDRFAELLTGSPLLYLPLAAEDPSDPRFSDWIASVFAPRDIANITVCKSMAQAGSLDLREYGGLLMGGGNTYLLLHRLRETGLDTAIQHAAARGFPIYGGSAGAIVMGAHIETCAHLDENQVGLRNFAGLNLCRGKAVWCHFVSSDQPKIRQLLERRESDILAISEDAGVLVDGSGLWGLGAGRAELWSSVGSQALDRWGAA